MEALGASPQKMAFSEVYGALQTGVVDGQENTWSNIYGKKFFEVQDGITETNHGIIDYLVVTSSTGWDSLPMPDVRDQPDDPRRGDRDPQRRVHEVNEEAKAGGDRRRRRSARADARAAAGLGRAMKPVWEQFEDDVGADNIAAAQKRQREN